MMKTKEAQTKQKRIEDLTLDELDMVCALMRVQDWPDVESSRVYMLSVDDVHKICDNYPQLREAFLNKPLRDILTQAQESELTTKTQRKRRSDARFATTTERQAAYRARLKEKRDASLEQPPPSNETDSPGPDVEEPSATVCEAPIPEIDPEEAETQHSACDRSADTRHWTAPIDHQRSVSYYWLRTRSMVWRYRW
jgi:hypothetical protein